MAGAQRSRVVAIAAAVPVSKPLWSPSYVLITAGIAYLMTAATHRLVDVGPGRPWTRPLVVLGCNALAAYTASVLFAFLLKPWQADLVRPLTAGASIANSGGSGAAGASACRPVQQEDGRVHGQQLIHDTIGVEKPARNAVFAALQNVD